MSESRNHAESILIDASPEEVYAVVSDVTRTGEWSPVCRESWWDEGDDPRKDGSGSGTPRVGAHFFGRNVIPEREWTTRCEVTAAEPGKVFGWSVAEGKVEWAYLMEPVDGGTRLTETWEFTPVGLDYFHATYGEDAPARIEARTQEALSGIPATLAAIKGIIEGQ